MADFPQFDFTLNRWVPHAPKDPMDEVVCSDGFTHRQLKEAFDEVADPADRRGPIDARIPRDNKKLVWNAIVFFTATEPFFGNLPGNLLHVKAEGYRNGPAGP